jgi:hypothetical protein
MALGQLRQEHESMPQPRAKAPTWVDVSTFEPAPSPALLLQQRVQQSVAAKPHDGKWPVYQRVALIVTVSAALWMALLAAGAKAIQVAQPLIA